MSDLRSLISKLENMPHGSAQVEAARELWNLVSQESDASLRFEALCEILKAALFSGATDYFFSLMPQLARLKKDHPEAIDLYEYIWRLKWLTGNMSNYPEVPRARILQAEDEYERELLNAGGNKRTAIYMRWSNAVSMGRLEESAVLREQFLALKRDVHADCLACEASGQVWEAISHDNYAEAKERARVVFSNRMSCGSVPHTTYANLALPAELNGDSAEAASYFKKGYKLVRTNVNFVATVGRYLTYLTASGEDERALRLLRTHLPWLEQNRNPDNHYDFLIGATAVCRALAEKRKRAIKLPLPGKWLAAWGAKPLALAELAERFEAEGRSIAAAFDRRNENSWHMNKFNRTLTRIHERRASRPVAVSQEAGVME
ncbi:hypothetical protein [Prosthecobacter sp.]|uniref:hypothetical protein n=1 Tax=Prosthecobacter sp. TaxID=1965333 RepID=UPI00378362DB